jgi:beta-lactamase regulating signal transducer with metallopeptidase domain
MTSTVTEAAVALSSSLELSILGKATIMLALGLAAVRLAGRARASRRHLLLAATFTTLLALPLVAVTAPGVTIELATSPAADSDSGSGSAGVQASPAAASAAPAGAEPRAPDRGGWSMPSWTTVLRAGWIAGAAFLALWLLVDLWRLARLRRDGLPWLEMRGLARSLADECGVRRPVDVLLHENIAGPMTYGALRSVIMLPANAREGDEADLRRALVHELEHVRRGDWLVQIAARAMCAVYWFHPLVWMAWRKLCLEAERACDDAVVRSAERTEYAEQLVSLARRMSRGRTMQALGMANRSDLAARVAALLDGGQERGRAGLLATAGVMGAACLVVIAVAPVRAVAQSEAPKVIVDRETGPRTAEESRATALDQALYDAAGAGDVSEMARLLEAGANVNCAIEGDGSPLIAAAREGWTEAVRFLLDRGADPNMAVSGDGNPLIMAARDGHLEVVALLLDRGARIDEVVPEDENALIQASAQGRLDIVKLLVARGADVNARVRVEAALERPNGEWRSPLSMARRGKHEAVVAYLRSAGARE